MSKIESLQLNQQVLKHISLTSQENILMKSFEKFYELNENIDLFIPIVCLKLKISIRLIDYFVTKYSKINKTCYKINENNVDQTFNVFTSYKQQLKNHQKKYFDPFSRGDRIPYFMNEIPIITTIGQLNFYKWFISKKVHEYILKNHDEINNEMKKKNKQNIKKTKKKIKIKKNFKKLIITKQNNKAINSYTSNTSLVNYNETNMICSSQKTDKIIVSFSFL
jgi:hypothetical protein